jgi:AraC-like DNA-binding protein
MRPLDTMTVLLLAGAIQGLVLAVLLLGKRKPGVRSNRLLAAIMMGMALSVAIHALAGVFLPEDTLHFGVTSLLTALCTQLSWLYARALAFGGRIFRRRDLPHLLAPLALSVSAVLYWLSPGQDALMVLFVAIFNIMVLGYLGLAMWICLRQARFLKDNYAAIGPRSLRWLLVLLGLQAGLWLTMAIAWTLIPEGNWDPVWGLVCLVFFIMGFAGFRRSGFLEDGGMAGGDHSETVKGEPGGKYRNSTLDAEHRRQYRERLERVIAERRPHLVPDLSLATLAGMVGVTPHQLSQVLNEVLGRSFYDFINGARIQDAQAALRDPAKNHLTIAAIAQDLGYNSLSTFNLQFRRFTGTTPSSWRAGT